MFGRRLATTATLSVAVVVLVVMALWGYHAATQPVPGLGGAVQSCTKAETITQHYVKRTEITVSVFNAGAATGAAARTMQRLENLGFNPGAVANAPQGMHVRRAKVLTTLQGDEAAKLVALALGPHVPVVVSDNDLGPGVDVLVGPRLHHLNPKAPTRLKLTRPTSTCVGVS